jgi:hypothetical protein
MMHHAAAISWFHLMRDPYMKQNILAVRRGVIFSNPHANYIFSSSGRF